MNALITVEQFCWADHEAMSISELCIRLQEERGYSEQDAEDIAWQWNFANSLLGERASIDDYRTRLADSGVASTAADHLAHQMLHFLNELRIVTDCWRPAPPLPPESSLPRPVDPRHHCQFDPSTDTCNFCGR